MISRTLCALPLAIALFVSAAHAAPADDLQTIIADHWKWWLSINPVQATALGVHDFDDKLGDLSLAEQDREAKAAQAFLDRLSAIPDQALSVADRTNKGVLVRMLSDQVEGNRYGERMILFTTYYGWHQGFAGIADNLPFRTRADYESYLKRLALYPKLNGDAIAISRQAVAKGYVQPCDALAGFEDTITGAVQGEPEDTRFFGPFKRQRPVDMSDAEWTAMQARAVAVIRDVVAPEYAKFAQFYLKDYKPKCRKTVGASAMPQGAAWYAFQARSHTTTNLSPEQIHQIGLSEVARIKAEMVKVATDAGYPSREAFIAKLRTDPAYYAKTPEELLAAASRVAKQIDGKMPQFFGKLPRLPYGVREIPKETAETTTTAYYNGGSPESGIAGNFYVNTSKLSQRPLWELPALTAHEAVPGHHNQIALQQELPLLEFRKNAAGFTAFVEGWGLYSEHLGIEMGLYDTPEKNMGRLSYEMWRACRLVVDTGMHAKGWTKAQAIAFMRDNSALSDANIEAEVNRYISWPGQALGYKLGELKIRELRARAEAALGPKFDLRRFHDAVLGQGPVPLDVLERQITDWIDAETARP
ncbi:DUF885 domain-containing protein [Aquisediminimonas profunda]|uniref:DUF885 domain-containing protein n=1 Tax=Aquisediminimonas profunda TaxID=1550733 RepID=UPI001C62A8C3|nr:DUF885 domain-containing protein [Aquisediminimonas profunda]